MQRMQTVVRLPEEAAPAISGRTPRLRAVHLLIGSIFALLVANLGRVPLIDSGATKEAPLLLNDLLVMALVLLGAVMALRARRLQVDAVAGLALGFAAIGGFSAVVGLVRFNLSLFELAFSLAYLARWITYFGIYLLIINFLTRDDVPSVARALEAAILIFAGFGIFQSIFLPGFAQLVYPDSVVGVDWDDQGRRLVSTFLDPNFAGMFIVAGLLLQIARISFGERVKNWRVILLMVALVLTASRSAVLALGAGSLLIAGVRGNAKSVWRLGGLSLLILIALAPVILGLLQDFDRISAGGSAAHRIVNWLLAIQIFIDNPVIGIGYNTFGYVVAEYGRLYRGAGAFGLDGSILFVAVTTGFVGLLLYGWMLVLVLGRCAAVWRPTSRPSAERAFSLGVAAILTGMVAHSFFLNTLFQPFMLHVTWVLWGLAFVLSRSAPAYPPRRAPLSPSDRGD